MPDLYAAGDYDLAGFCVGVVERRRVIDGRAIVPGDVVLGLASSGLHSNGFSLVRKVVFEMAGLSVDDYVDELLTSVGEALLTPTRIYAQPVRRNLAHYKVKGVVHGIAHITGGGLLENLARILPEGAQAVIERGRWSAPPVFDWLKRLGHIDDDEMARVFNMGVGLVLVVSDFYADSIAQQLAEQRIENWTIGRIVAGPRGAVWK